MMKNYLKIVKKMSPQYKVNLFRKWRKRDRREDRRVYFFCNSCNSGFKAFQGCKIKEVFCGECGRKMLRARGFFCDIRPELRKCDGCGCCDTGTDADFDRYAVEVQNGEGYYDASGTYRSYRKYDD